MGSWGRLTEELKFEVTRGIYVENVLNFRARFYKSYEILINAYQSKTTVKYRTTLKYKNDGTALDPAISQPKPIIRQ